MPWTIISCLDEVSIDNIDANPSSDSIYVSIDDIGNDYDFLAYY